MRDRSLQSMESAIQGMAICLKTLSVFIDNLPFLVRENGLDVYRAYDRQYRDMVGFYRTIASDVTYDIRALIADERRFTQIQTELRTYLIEMFTGIAASLTHPGAKGRFIEVRDAFTHNDRQRLDTSLSALVRLINDLQADFVKQFDSRQLRQPNNDLIRRLGEEKLTAAKNLQHTIYALRINIRDFVALQRGSRPQVIPVTSVLAKETYSTLVLAVHILRPEDVCVALQQQLHFVKIKHTEVREKVTFLQQRLGRSFAEAIRV